MSKIHSLIIPSHRGNSYRNGKHIGYGGLRHPKHISEFNKITECSLVMETERGELKLARHSQSSRRHIEKKTENRRWRRGIQRQTEKMIEDETL